MDGLKLFYGGLIHVELILYLPIFLLKGLVLSFEIVKLLLQLFILIVSDHALLLSSLPLNLNSFKVFLGLNKLLKNLISFLYHEIYRNES